MKKVLIGLTALCLAGPVFGLDKADLDDRMRGLMSKLDSLQAKPDKKIPADTLAKAQGVILLDRTKAGFIFAYQGGGGVAFVRDSKTGGWSPPAFLKANEASLGFQIGGEQNFFVILLMTTNATRLLTDSNFEFGGEAHGTAGNASGTEEGKVGPLEKSVVVYDDREGLFGGASVKGGAVSPDEDGNRVFYGQAWGMRDILFEKRVKGNDVSAELAKKLTEYSKSSGK